MHIATKPNAVQFAACPYPLACKHHDFLKQEIKNLLDARIMHKSMSPWASPVVVVKTHTWRCTTTVLLVHRLQEIEHLTASSNTSNGHKEELKIGELFALLKGARYFTAMDLWSGYYLIKLDEESIFKCAFTTDIFGVNKVCTQCQGSGCLAYLDNILIYSRTENEHLEILDKAFKHLLKAVLKIKLSKCSFFIE